MMLTCLIDQHTDEKYQHALVNEELEFLNRVSNKIMMNGKMWELKFNATGNTERSKMVTHATYQFNSCYAFYNLSGPNRKYYDEPVTWINDALLSDLLYPHCDLETKWHDYDKNSVAPLPSKQVLENLKRIYSEIARNEENDDMWFEVVLKTKDDDFVRHNTERRLGFDLKKQKLWLLYLDYLEKNNKREFLQTCSKYVRFFMDDEEALQKYREAATAYAPCGLVQVPWTNPFEFEVHDPKFFEKEAPRQSYKRTEDTLPKSCMFRFSANNALRQLPSLPFHQMIYIRENASAHTLLKLNKCCKEFRIKSQKTVVHSIQVSKHQPAPFKVEGPSIRISSKWATNTTMDNVFIANKFNWESIDGSAPYGLSKFIPRIFKCDVKYLRILNQNLSLKELDFLMANENLESLELYHVADEDGKKHKVESIFSRATSIEKICLSGMICTNETASKFAKTDFKRKLTYFTFGKMQDDRCLNVDDFVLFAETKFHEDVMVWMSLQNENTAAKKIFNDRVAKAVKDIRPGGNGCVHIF